MAGSQGVYRTPALGMVENPGIGFPGAHHDISVTRQGAQVTQDQVLYWAIQGRTFHTQVGDAHAQVDFVITTYDENRPQFALRVPAGRTVIPLSFNFTAEIAAGTINHMTMSSTTNDIGNSSTSVAGTITPMRRDAPHASGCVSRNLYTADSTTATGLIEIWRWLDPFVLTASSATMAGRQFQWDVRRHSSTPILVGPATLQMNLSSTSNGVEGFLELVWAEFETPQLVSV